MKNEQILTQNLDFPNVWWAQEKENNEFKQHVATPLGVNFVLTRNVQIVHQHDFSESNRCGFYNSCGAPRKETVFDCSFSS